MHVMTFSLKYAPLSPMVTHHIRQDITHNRVVTCLLLCLRKTRRYAFLYLKRKTIVHTYHGNSYVMYLKHTDRTVHVCVFVKVSPS